MKRIPDVVMSDKKGIEEWRGSLHEFLKTNAGEDHGGQGRETVRDFVQAMRASFASFSGETIADGAEYYPERPGVVSCGGGAAPVFLLSLVER
jgi:hypothetical protein